MAKVKITRISKIVKPAVRRRIMGEPEKSKLFRPQPDIRVQGILPNDKHLEIVVRDGPVDFWGVEDKLVKNICIKMTYDVPRGKAGEAALIDGLLLMFGEAIRKMWKDRP